MKYTNQIPHLFKRIKNITRLIRYGRRILQTLCQVQKFKIKETPNVFGNNKGGWNTKRQAKQKEILEQN